MAYQPKSYKKFVATAATATLVASAVVPTALAASSFTDVSSNYTEAVDYLVTEKITEGISETLFGTTTNIKRGDAAIFIANALKLDTANAADQDFTDVNSRVEGAVNAIVAAGIASGKTESTFAPDDYITRAEMAKILVNAYKLKAGDTENTFTDVNSTWDGYVDALVASGVTLGLTETTFGATENVTRGQFALFIFRAENPTITVTSATATDAKTLSVVLSDGTTNVVTLPTALEANKATEVTFEIDGKEYKATVTFVVSTPTVVSVTAVNATKLEVKFNQAIDKNTISLADFTISPLDGQTLTTLEGTLSADGTTYTIETTGAEFLTKRYDVKLADKVVKSALGKDVAKYETTITVKDEVAPKITATNFVSAGTGKVDVTVKFDEKVASLGTVSVNGTTVSPTFTANSKEFKLTNLDAGKTYNIDVIGATDVAGNIANPLSTSVTTTADTALPTANVSVTSSTIKIDFSEEVNNTTNTFVVKVNGGTALTAVKDAKDSTVYTVDASTELGGSTFLNNAKINVTNIYDLAGNKGQDVELTANLTKDTTAPKFVSASVENAKLVLKYDEAIKASTATNITEADLTIKYVDKDGVLVTLAPTTDFTASTVYGNDLNGNTTIDAGTEEQQYVVITLAETTAGKDFITTAGKLTEGTFTVTVAKDQLEDAAGNKVAASTLNVLAGSGTAAKTVTYTANNTSLPNNQFKVVYSEPMANTALVAANYTLGGAALPTGTTLTFVDNKQNVLVTLPEGFIVAAGERVLVASNVTALDGDTQNTTDQTIVTIPLKENVAPVASKLSIVSDTQAVVDFSEVVTGATTGITVKLNGTTVSPTLTNTSGDLQVTFATATLKATDKVTVEFSSAVLADAAGNKIKDSSVSN